MADTPPPPPGYEPTPDKIPAPAGYEPVAAPGLLESFSRGAAEGATFGFDDKLGLDKERREASRKANPWTHFMGEIAGGAVPMAVAALLPTGATQVAAGARGAQLAGRGAGLVRSALVPGEIATAGQAFKEGAKLGAVYGGLSGAGHTDVKPEDSLAEALTKRGTGALTGAGTGALVGAPLGVAGHGIYRGAQSLGGLRAAAQAETDVGSGALTTAVRRLERDRITPDELIAQIRSEFPDDSATAGLHQRFWGGLQNKQPITADQVEETVRRAMLGETPSEISTALRTINGGQGPGEASVKTLLDELAERHLGPLNLVDRASMVRKGAGDNTQMTMRAAAATPGEHLGIARENLLERQLGAQGRLGAVFDRMIGSGDFEGVAARHADDLQKAGHKAFGLAYANEQPFNLQPILDKWITKYEGKGGPIPEGIMSEISGLMGKNKTAPATLEDFILARQGLFDAKRAAAKDSPNLSRKLNELYDDISNEVAKTNPLWKEANDIWRDGKAAEDALEAGSRMVMRLNSGSRENLSVLQQAQKDVATAQKAVDLANKPFNAHKRKVGPPPTQAQIVAQQTAQAKLDAANTRQELFKVGLVRSLNDMLQNQGETHNLTKQLLLPGAQKIIRQVLGKDADQFYKAVRAEQAMHRTYQSQFGSQTTPLREALDELNWAPRFEASWHNLGLGKALQLAQEYAARNINTRRNTDLMKLYTETDPLKQLEALRAMQTLHTARSNAGNLAGKPAIGLGSGLLPEHLVGVEAERSNTPVLKPYKP